MRITNEVIVSRSVDRLQNRLRAYEKAQSQLASGYRIQKPSDDPAGTRRALSLTAAMRAREQELASIDDARGWLDSADTQLQTVLSRTSRARDLTVEGATVKDEAAARALANEIRSIRDEIIAVSNDRRMDRPLFGGFTNGQAVELADPDDPAGGWRTNGADGTGWHEITRRVSDTELPRINVTAGEFLGFGPDGQPLEDADGNAVDLLSILTRAAEAIEAGDSAEASALIGDITTASTRVANVLAEVGTTTNRVEAAQARARDLQLTLRTELSNVRDVDMAEGIMELQVQQVAFEATLQALAKALPPSLAGFLR